MQSNLTLKHEYRQLQGCPNVGMRGVTGRPQKNRFHAPAAVGAQLSLALIGGLEGSRVPGVHSRAPLPFRLGIYTDLTSGTLLECGAGLRA